MRSLSSLRARGAVLVCLCGLLAGLPAYAQRASTAADRATQLLEEAEFDKALKVVNEALADSPPAAQIADLYELQGTIFLYQGREDKARQSFERLLRADPSYQLPKSSSPKIRALFESVRNERPAPSPPPPPPPPAPRPQPKVTLARLEEAPPGKPLELQLGVRDAPASAKAKLFYRRKGASRYSSVSFAKAGDGELLAYVPAYDLPEQERAYGLDYYVELSEGGRRLAGAGTASDPLTVRILAGRVADSEVASAPWHKKWWVWAIAGGVAAGTAAAIAVPLMLEDEQAHLPVTVRVTP